MRASGGEARATDGPLAQVVEALEAQVAGETLDEAEPGRLESRPRPLPTARRDRPTLRSTPSSSSASPTNVSAFAQASEGAGPDPELDAPRLDALDAPVEPPEPPLPPARPDGAPARIRLEPGLTVEVDVQEEAVEVTLEGDAEAVEPLSDLGRALQSALEPDGFDLDSFGHRRRPGERRTDLYRPRRLPTREPADTDDSPRETATPRPSGDGRGRLVNLVV